MLIVALVISGLTVRIRAQAESARHRERRIAALYALSRDLATTRDVDSLLDDRRAPHRRGVSRPARSPAPGTTTVARGASESPAGFAMDPAELGRRPVGVRAPQLAGLGTATLPGRARPSTCRWSGRAGRSACSASSPADTHALESPEQLHQLETFANQMALAIERAPARARRHSVPRCGRRPSGCATRSGSSVSPRPQDAARLNHGAVEQPHGERRPGSTTRRRRSSPIHPPGGRAARSPRQQPPRDDAARGRRGQHPQGVAAAGRGGRRRAQAAGEQLRDRAVHVECPADLPLVPIDAMLVEQVLINLLDNAVKYTPPEARSAWRRSR